MTTSLRRSSDAIAERMRALNAVPDGRSDAVDPSTSDLLHEIIDARGRCYRPATLTSGT